MENRLSRDCRDKLRLRSSELAERLLEAAVNVLLSETQPMQLLVVRGLQGFARNWSAHQAFLQV